MARKSRRNKIKETYQSALMYTGHQITGRETIKKLKNMWQQFRKDYQDQYQERPDSLYKYAKAYNKQLEESIDKEYIPVLETEKTELPFNLPVISFERDYVAQFLNRLETIKSDTYEYIESNRTKGHESGKLASIASYQMDEMERIYYEIIAKIRELCNQYPIGIVAQAIADNVELDYTIAVTLMPPSDVYVEFEATLDQILGIEAQLEARASELAEQAESEYYNG